MTVDEWRALTAEARAAAWTRMSVEERRDFYGQLAASTPVWGLPYPEDYNDPADSPTVLRALALATDLALSLAASTPALPFGGFIQNADRALTPDSTYQIPFDETIPQPPGTVAAVTTAGGVQTVTTAGLYLVELACHLLHPNVGAKGAAEVRLTPAEWGQSQTVEQTVGGLATRVALSTVQHFPAGAQYGCQVRMVGAASSGWSMTYALNQITQVR